MHLFLVHALLLGQSELTKHSGRHPSYGFPKYPVMHIHAPAPSCSLHSAFAPQGDGVHGFIGSICAKALVLHWTAASPVKPSGHTHIGVWLITRHSALMPHACAHGSWHFVLMQAILGAHSLFARHSGRQLGGAPINSGIHWHEGVSPFEGWQIELGPHGDGWHGLTGKKTAVGAETMEFMRKI